MENSKRRNGKAKQEIMIENVNIHSTESRLPIEATKGDWKKLFRYQKKKIKNY